MADNLYRVTITKDGQVSTRDFSEEDYNAKALPFLQSNYTPDQYSVVNLQTSSEEDVQEDGDYLVTISKDGMSQSKSYSGRELIGGKLEKIRQAAPGSYSLQKTTRVNDYIGMKLDESVARMRQAEQNVNAAADYYNPKKIFDSKIYTDPIGAYVDAAEYHGMTTDAETLEQEHQAMMEEINLHAERYANQQALSDTESELADINAQLAVFEEHEKAMRRSMSEGGTTLVNKDQQFLQENAEEYERLKKRRDELVELQRSNPLYQEIEKNLGLNADDVINAAQPILSAAAIAANTEIEQYDPDLYAKSVEKAGAEPQVWQAAKYFADQAKKTLGASYSDDNGFGAFLKGHADTFSDYDFWMMGLNSIASHFQVKDVFEKIAGKVKNYSDNELTDQALDEILTDGEKALLKSFVTLSHAQAIRELNTHNMYGSGATSAESIGFMAQFIISGGIVKGAATAAEKTFAKYLTKLVNKSARSMVAKGAARGATAAVMNAVRLGGEGVEAVVMPLAKAVPMTLLQTGLYKDFATKMTERDEYGNLAYGNVDEDGKLDYEYGRLIKHSFRDAGLEVWSEMALSPVLNVFGKAMGVAGKGIMGSLEKKGISSAKAMMMKTKLDDIGKFLHSREAMKILVDAGFDGYFEEIGEEILGAWVSKMWDEKSWERFWEKDNLVSMAVAFAPMSVLGGGMSMANYAKRSMKYAESEPVIRQMLQPYIESGRYTQEEIDEMFNRKCNTMEDVGNKISSLIAPIVEHGQMDEETFEALFKFVDATAQKEIAEKLTQRVTSDRRAWTDATLRDELNGRTYTSSGAEGEMVSYTEDENGNRMYFLTDQEQDGKFLSFDSEGGDVKFRTPEGEMKTMGKDQFLDAEYEAARRRAENKRMAEEKAAKNASVAEKLQAGQEFVMYNDQEGEKVKYTFDHWEGENAAVVRMVNGKPVMELIPLQKIANAFGIDVSVLTDAEREQASIEESRRKDSLVRMGNRAKGFQVRLGGYEGRLQRVFVKSTEDGAQRLMASILQKDGSVVETEVTEKEIDQLSSSAVPADSRGERNKARKEADKKRKEANSAYSAAKKRFTSQDGKVREGEFLDADPEGFCRYSDEKYGKDDTNETLRAAIAKAQKALAKAMDERQAESDPDRKQDLRKAYEAAKAKVDKLVELLGRRTQDESSRGALDPEAARKKHDELLARGLSEEEIAQLAQTAIDEAQAAISAIPKPEVTTDVDSYLRAKKAYADAVAKQQAKIDFWKSVMNAPSQETLDRTSTIARYRREAARIAGELRQAKTPELRRRLEREQETLALNSIRDLARFNDQSKHVAELERELGKDAPVPVDVVTYANILDTMRKNGLSEATIAKMQRKLAKSQLAYLLGRPNTIGGIHCAGKVYIFAEGNPTTSRARITYAHEAQHEINSRDPHAMNSVLALARNDRETLRGMLKSIIGESGFRGYEDADAQELADEIVAYTMQEAVNGGNLAERLKAKGVSEELTNLISKEYERQQRNAEGRDKRSRDRALNDGGTHSGELRTDAGAEDAASRDEQLGSPRSSDGRGDSGRSEESIARDAATAAGGGIDLGGGEAPIRQSISAGAEGSGLEVRMDDGKGNVAFVHPDGRVFTGKTPITADDLIALDNTPLSYMVADAQELGTITSKQAVEIFQKYADMLNASLVKGLKENGGFENLSSQWQWVGETVYKTVATNGDKQYSYSLDITRVCKKNEAVIMTIAETQRRLGYGITPGQIMDIYLASKEEGYQVPCPVCYVFSRYINNGKYATIMINGQKKFGDLLVDPSTLTDEQKAEKIAMWQGLLEEAKENNKKNAKAITDAKKELKFDLEQIDKLGQAIMRGELTGKAAENARRRIQVLDGKYRAALDVVAQSSLDSWIKQFAIHEVGGEWQLYDDTFQGFPEEIALDLRETATAMTKYPAIQRYRNSRGAGAGKEITFAANNDFGEVAMMLGSMDTPNYYKMAAQAEDEKTRAEYRAKAQKRFLAAHKYAQQQSLRGGQRMWSWSDNIEKLAPDVFMNLLQLQMLGGALQSYSKQLEGIKLVASMGGYVNGSLMGKGIGYREVAPADVENLGGRLFVKGGDFNAVADNGRPIVLKAPVFEQDGRYYTLEFDDVVGIDAYGRADEKDGHHLKGLFELNEAYDKAGNILVGMNDLHIRTAMADDRVYFIIPWHASGNDVHILRQMLGYLEVDLHDFNPKNYTTVQEEKKVDKVSPALQKFWESHRNEADFRCGIAGGIPSGTKGELSEQQRHYKELRDAIFIGVKRERKDADGNTIMKDGAPVMETVSLEEYSTAWMQEVLNDEFLSQAYAKVRKFVDAQEMTNADTGFIYPYEYWDEQSTYWTADVNGARYLEYCRRLGYKPKFCGTLGGKKDFGNFADDKGYWKLLIDRRMYDTRGNFQDLTPVTSENFTPDLVDPEKTAKEFYVTKVADEDAARKVADKVIEKEVGYTGTMPAVNYDKGFTLDNAVDNFNLAVKDFRAFEKTMSKAEKEELRLSVTPAADNAEEQRESQVRFSIVTDQAEIDRLNSEPYEKVYHAMQLITRPDGRRYLYPPMAAVQGDEYVEGIPVNDDDSIDPMWERADERQDLAFMYTKGKKGKKVPADAEIENRDGKMFYKGQEISGEVDKETGEFVPNWYFALKKGNKGDKGKKLGDLEKVAFDPYQHSGLNAVNDQFTTAYDRSHLVIVKARVPRSEFTGESGYKAERAKLGVGMHEWTGGKLQTNNRRQVVLSRWDMPERILTDAEVAEDWKKVLEENNLTEVPFNIVTPGQREALINLGVKIGEPTKDNGGQASWDSYREWMSSRYDALTDDQRRALDLIGEKPEAIRASVSADVDWESLERNGEDVSADRMKEVFGIESTYIGKDARNNAYDSLLKVAKTFGVSPNALSFGGTLGIRYYTGRANAVAFFSLTDPVSWNVYRGRQMKITGINDPYVFAHEWFHALDNFLTQTEEDRKKGEIKGNFTSAGFEATREAVTEAIRDIERAMKKSGFNARIKEVSDDVFGSYYSNRSYWKSKIEKNARAVEMLFAMRNGMLESLQEDGNKMYPTEEEMKTIAPAIDKFFDTLEEKTDEQGYKILFSITPEMESEYDEAVKSGNTEKAQELVDEVAAKSGYGIKAAHYTNSEFTVFDKDKLGSNTGWEDASLGFHFLPEGTDEKQGRQFGSRKMDVYIKGNNILDIRTLTPELEKLIQEDIDAYDSDMTVDEAYQEMIFDGPSVKEFLRDIDVFSKGYDAVVANFGAGIGEYIVPDASQIKSAEPFTFDENGELIPLSERFNKKSEDIRFSYTKENPTAVETIAAEGIDKFLEGKDFSKGEWLTNLLNSPDIDAALKKRIIDEALADGGRFAAHAEDVLLWMAGKDSLTPQEQSLADAAAKELSKIAGEEVTANDVLWTLYSEAHANDESLMERKRNLEVRRNLGKRAKVGPEMTPEEGFNQAMEVKDELTEAYDKMKDDSLSKYNEQLDEAAYLQDIAEAMNSRRDYDRLSVGKMVNLLRKMISAGTLDNASRSTVKRILAVVRKTNGMRNITSVANKLYDVLLDSCTKNMETLYGKVIGRKAAKVDSKGVSAQGALDVDGQKIMDAYKRNVISARDEEGNEVAISTEEINKKILELTDKLTSKNPAVVKEAELEIAGLNLARRYADDVQSVRVELKRLAAEDKEKKEEVATGKIDKKSYREFRKEYNRTVRALKSSRYAALTELTRDLLDIADASHSRALDFVKAQKEHVAEIHHNCNSEMEGKSANQYNPNDGFLAKMTNNPVVGFFLSPLATFDQMLRWIGRKSVNGEGYLWNRFMRGWVRATGNEFDGVRECFRELDAKVSEVFGKVSKKGKAKMKWSDLYSVERRMPKVEVSLYQDPRHVDKDGNRVKDTIKLSQGNLLYILLADQMTDGRMKLRAMGIDEEQIEAIRAQMDPRFIELAEWLVKDFLPSRREKYNAVHERMFGAPMAKVDNYFPLKINKRSRTQAIDVTTADRNPSTASTVTGSIIKRVHNITAIDIKTDAFSAVIEHVQNMERWAAFAEFNRDVNTMLSYNDFKNQVINENSIYGSGQELWDKFCKVCMIATGFYKAEGNSDTDRKVMKFAKGATAAAISLRSFTAIKQLLSFPAYFAEANISYLSASLLMPWAGVIWAKNSLPMFRKRWESRQAGDHILSTSENWRSRLVESLARTGMTMNAAVDALTVAMGSYAIYLTKRDRYLKMGFNEADAEQRAKEDAVILYNETQQSNEAAFLSTIQMDRSVATASLTVFRNSSMGYTRQQVDAVRNLTRRMGKGYAKESKAYMAQQLEREGLSKADAERAAKSIYKRQGFKDAVRVGVFGWLMQFAWNMGSDLVYLLFGDDDDKKKEMREDCAVHALFGGIEGLALGGSLSEAFNSLAKGEGFKLDLSLLPFFSNLETLVSEFSRDEVTAINDMINLAIQMGLGVNPQTIEDVVLAVVDACNGDPKTGREALFLALRVLAVPQSQLDELYIDEIQAKAIDAKEMTVEEMARRYAEYKLRRGALTTAWLYDDAERAEKMEKYMKRLEGKLSDRDNLDEVGRRINDLAEQGKEMENRVNGLRERQRDGDADADRQLMEIYSSEDYGRLLRFKEESKTIKAEVDKAMQADNVDEMTSHLAKANELRKRLYDNYEPAEGSDAYYLDRFSQYTRGLLPYMAEMDKKYQKQYMDAHPEFQAAMAKYQEALDSASEDAQTNREKILKLEEERKGYKHPYKKNKYLPQYENRVKEIRAEIKELKAAGTTPAAVRKKLMKKYEIGPETYMPKDILESPAYKLYLEMRGLGSVSGNAFNFKAVDDYDRMINESTNPRTKDNYETRKMERKVLLGLEMQNILDGKPAEE